MGQAPPPNKTPNSAVPIAAAAGYWPRAARSSTSVREGSPSLGDTIGANPVKRYSAKITSVVAVEY